MSSAKKMKKKKEAKKEVSKELPPQVVTRTLADNTYVGIIREGQLGEQFLECPEAKYRWQSNVSYEGPFVNSRIEGKGRYQWPDGSSYEGELQNGKRHGSGIYVSADGMTRYEGQWRAGKRSGQGRLSYKQDGSSFYDGEWQDGKKHGQGKQVWPTGNSYDGQWEEGKMSGEGTMIWRTGGTSEQYVGLWRSSEPHGHGVHTWHSTDITLASSAAGMYDAPQRRPVPFNPQQQQLNNRYEGQFVFGKRDGSGTFYYANGAYYRGEWKDHMKHGSGRHTFEDGTVYEGPFVEDRMINYNKPSSAEGTELLSRSMDLSDLEGLALPSDRSAFEASLGAGYTDYNKIFREIYNMLLRHLGELREVYAKYRAAIPLEGADPFSLQSYQFWLFARDAGLLTPACSLPRFNRAVFSGPRQHGETAPEDLPEVAALQRSELTVERRVSVAAVERPSSGTALVPAGSRPGTSESQADGNSQSSDASSNASASSLPSPSNAAGAASETSGAQSRPNSSEVALRRLSQEIEGEERGAESTAGGVPLGRGFHRTGGTASLADIHATSKSLLFRQFLEGIVRLAHMRYPHERGLEVQIQRIFKENILPPTESQNGSEHIFAFLSDKSFKPTLQEFHDELWSLFQSPGPGGDTAGERYQPGLATDYYGKVRRDLHVSARLDVSLRVKDVLRLLDSCGLLHKVPPATPDVSRGAGEDSAVDDDASADENGSGGSVAADKEVANFFNLDAASQKMPTGIGGMPSSKFSFMPASAMMANDSFGELGGEKAPKGSRKKDKKDGAPGAPGAGGPEGGQEAGVAAVADELVQCDFSVTPQQVLKILCDVLGPRCAKGVCYEIGGLASEESAEGEQQQQQQPPQPDDDQYSLLEYAESELVFAEFLRLLVQVAELGSSKHASLAERAPLPQRFDGFLRLVFLPALRRRYEAPAPKEEASTAEGGGGAGGARAGSKGSVSDTAEAVLGDDEDEGAGQDGNAGDEDAAGGDAKGGVGEGNEAAGEEEEGGEGEAAAPPPPPPEPELWPGFEGPLPEPRKEGAAATAVAAASRGLRRWPAGYEDEVLDW